MPGTATLAAIEGLVELGMTPAQALVAATKNGAIASQGLKDFGTIETGKYADRAAARRRSARRHSQHSKAVVRDEGRPNRRPQRAPRKAGVDQTVAGSVTSSGAAPRFG